MADPRIPTGPSQYDELDRAFGVPDPADGATPQPLRALEPYEQALDILDNVRRQAMDTATLGRLEELINALEVLYGPGVAYPLRDALGTLGAAMNHAWADLGRARRFALDDIARLKAACDEWANDYRTVDRMAQEHMDRLVTEEARRRHAEEVLRRLEELPGFLDAVRSGGYNINPTAWADLRRLISAHTATVAGVDVDPGPQPGSPRQHPEPNLGCATSLELLTELTTRFEIHRTEATDRLLAADTCRRLADHLDEITLSYRTIDG